MQTCIIAQNAENKQLCAHSETVYLCQLLLSGSENTAEKGDGRNVNARRLRGVLGKVILWTGPGYCKLKLTKAVLTYITQAQNHAS